MNWLYTACDGSSGYKTVRLLSEADAARLLADDTFYDATESELLGVLREQGAKRKAVPLPDLESTLYPVPDQVEPVEDLLGDESNEDQEEADDHFDED